MKHVELRRGSVTLGWLASRLPALALVGCASAHSHSPAHSPARSPAELIASPPSNAWSASGGEGARQRGEPRRQEPWSEPERRGAGLPWETGQALMQGFLGYTTFEKVSVDGSGSAVDGDEGDLDELPLIGGGAQWKLGGERVAFGIEGMLSFAGKANAAAFAVGGGGAAVAVDVDMLLFDLYGGPFVSLFLGEKLRLYAAAGPLMEWASWDQSGSALDDNGTGFGVGTYARTGFEFALPSHTLIGFGVRWSDSTVDLGSDLGDLDVEGFQGLFTVSRGL